MTLTGLAIGVVLAAIASRLMTTLLYGVRPDYIPTVAVVSLMLVGVAGTGLLRSRAPRLAHRPDDCPSAGMTAGAGAHLPLKSRQTTSPLVLRTYTFPLANAGAVKALPSMTCAEPSSL